ncbi:MAG: hypothetical protein LBK13_05545 [Spirochaetales bacterium]|jgi:hypothetical protein|nr:hypothetical protein [Spirochaetales bacterium]
MFDSVAVNSAGKVYASGFHRGTGTYDYGNGISVAGVIPAAAALFSTAMLYL